MAVDPPGTLPQPFEVTPMEESGAPVAWPDNPIKVPNPTSGLPTDPMGLSGVSWAPGFSDHPESLNASSNSWTHMKFGVSASSFGGPGRSNTRSHPRLTNTLAFTKGRDSDMLIREAINIINGKGKFFLTWGQLADYVDKKVRMQQGLRGLFLSLFVMAAYTWRIAYHTELRLASTCYVALSDTIHSVEATTEAAPEEDGMYYSLIAALKEKGLDGSAAGQASSTTAAPVAEGTSAPSPDGFGIGNATTCDCDDIEKKPDKLTLDTVYSLDHAWLWIQRGLFQKIFRPLFDTQSMNTKIGESPTTMPGRIAMWNQVVGGVRLRQRRAQRESCDIPIAMQTWYGDLCHPGENLTQDAFGPGSSMEMEGFMPQQGEPGAYYVSFNIEDSFDDVTAQMEFSLRRNNWIDDYTIGLDVEMITLNAEARMMSYVEIKFDRLNAGSVETAVQAT
jgi:hypothetical protein